MIQLYASCNATLKKKKVFLKGGGTIIKSMNMFAMNGVNLKCDELSKHKMCTMQLELLAARPG